MFTKTKLKFHDIFENRVPANEVRQYLVELHEKGETAEDIASAASSMREHCVPLNIPYSLKEELIDNCGTGGDNSKSFNISTTVAILIAACGSKIAKHGNRSITSNSGSADMLESLGVNLNINSDNQVTMLKQTGFCFMFAQNHHPAMKYIMPVRKSIPHRTIFNILGPLSNPAMVHKQIIGVFDKAFVPIIAEAMALLGAKRALVLSSNDNMDEISISDVTHACFIERGDIKSFIIDPREYGFDLYYKEEVEGGTPEENAAITKGVLNGSIYGAKRDIVIINAAFALLVDGKVNSTEEGIKLVKEAIENGSAYKKLEQIIEVSNSLVD